MSHSIDPPPIYASDETFGMKAWFQQVFRRLLKFETGEDTLNLIDGVTAPATVTGVAQIYVDVADGDLKVKFGDGVVKTIVIDT